MMMMVMTFFFVVEVVVVEGEELLPGHDKLWVWVQI